MSNTLDFNKIKKKFLTVTLADENQTTIMIGIPTKAIVDELKHLKTMLENLNEDADEETMSELYLACAKVMSRNKTGKKIEKEFLEKVFDFEDIIIFFNAYMNFINAFSFEKN